MGKAFDLEPLDVSKASNFITKISYTTPYRQC